MPNSLMKLTPDVAKAMNTTDKQGGRRRDDAAGALEADRDRACVLSPVRSCSSLMREQQEHLVVHRQAEGDAEHQDRRRRVERAGGREAEEAGEVAVLEDPHHRAERGGEDSRLSTSALTGTSTLPNIRNSSTKVASGDHGARPGAAVRRSTSFVSTSCGRLAADEHREAGVDGAHVGDESLAGSETGSTSGTTENHVPPVVAVEAGARGGVRRGDLRAVDVRARRGCRPGRPRRRRERRRHRPSSARSSTGLVRSATMAKAAASFEVNSSRRMSDGLTGRADRRQHPVVGQPERRRRGTAAPRSTRSTMTAAVPIAIGRRITAGGEAVPEASVAGARPWRRVQDRQRVDRGARARPAAPAGSRSTRAPRRATTAMPA